MAESAGKTPSRIQLLAMAYVDGEMDARGREEIEFLQRFDPALKDEVAEFRKLELLFQSWDPWWDGPNGFFLRGAQPEA